MPGEYDFFENDDACDFAYLIEKSKDVKKLFQKSFDKAINADYLEVDECHAAIISAVYLDALLNNSEYETADEKAFSNFLEANKQLALDDLKANAVHALQKVIGENSELNELWKENDELYSKWRQTILDLIERLK